MDIDVTKQSETYLSASFRRSHGGITVTVKTLPDIEDLIRSWGTGEIQDINVHGRSWTAIKGENPLRVYQLERDPGTLIGGGQPYRINRPGGPLAANPHEDGEGAINLGILRLVGISSPNGVAFQVKGVYTKEAITDLAMKFQSAARSFVASYLKPFEITVSIVGSQQQM